MSDRADRALEEHRRLRGKIETRPKAELTEETLEIFYTPGVGDVAERLADHPGDARELTWRANAVAVVSDGSAVLGLGDVGPIAALPVMEGKAALFKQRAGIDALPIVLGSQDVEEIVTTVRTIAPTFGAINLEDISAPRCYEIERRLEEVLDIPVVHDDQHATAIAVLAALINAYKVTGREIEEAGVVIVGAGAAGLATAALLRAAGVRRLVVTDSHGIVARDRDDLDEPKQRLAELTDRDRGGSVRDALTGADAVVGVSVAGAFDADDVRAMADDPIILALANPDPEIEPDAARDAGAAIVATGRSDHPNQVNNALVFPGLFRGLLDARRSRLDDDVKLAAARAITGLVDDPRPDRILPTEFDGHLTSAVAAAVEEAGKSG
jgi:malate dehydrogenase (oxaloacetate-decarboxylating)